MKKLIPILVLLTISINCGAQPWSPFTPGVKRYFTNNYGYLKGMRIDSVAAYGADLHYYPFPTARGPLTWNYPDTGGSWLGKTGIKKYDGTFLFPNRWGDTVKIKTQAAVGDSWVFYQDNSSVHYEAEVTALDTMTILGGLDSIRKILLTVYENGSPLLTDSFNNAEIILSKAHGFYQVFELYHFPFHEPDTDLAVMDQYFQMSVNPVILSGLGWGWTSLVGPYGAMFRLVDFVEPTHTYNWEVGDVLEYTYCWVSGGTTSGCSDPMFSLDTIVGKIVTNNGVEYITRGWGASRDTFIGMNAYYTLHPYMDTVSTFHPYLGLASTTLMPEEFDIANSFGPFTCWFYFPEDQSYCHPGELYYNCWSYSGISIAQTYTVHKNGMGIVHHNNHDGSGPSTDDRQLIYFKKNGVSCGTFFVPDTTLPVVNSVSQLSGEAAFKVYPNPTTDQLSIESAQDNYTLSIYNAVGQLVYRKAKCNSKELINVNSFASGAYHLKLKTDDGMLVHRKVIIQH